MTSEEFSLDFDHIPPYKMNEEHIYNEYHYELSDIQKEVCACEKEIILCANMLNKDNCSYRYGEIFERKSKLEDRIRVLKEELGIKNQLNHVKVI
jgi:hypothetical protein